MATRRRQSAPKGRNADRLFIGVYPTGIVYADKSREAHGDYARCAFLDFATLTLQFERDCPSDLRAEITRDAAKIQARRGEQFAIDASGHTVTLGGGRRTSENMNMASKPRKPIADMIEELRSWLPNYDHGPTDYPTLVWRLLASAPGGDEAEDMGYETFNISWQEIDQLGRMLEAIQDKRDVEDLIAGLMSEEDPEDLGEARRRPQRGSRPVSRRPVRRRR